MPGFKGVRVSKFRHVFGSPFQKEKCYEGLRITDNSHDSNFCAVNPKFLAIVLQAAGGGAFTVVPLKKTGRIESSYPKIVGHSSTVLDIKWSPFDDHLIASCSDDGLIKFWQIPEGGLLTNRSEADATLHGHTRKVTFLNWHPAAMNIIASIGYDLKIIVWNVDNAEQVSVIGCHSNIIYSLGWSWNGSTMVTTCKDKKLRIVEPRTGTVLKENKGHYGVKPFKAIFAGQSDLILTAGFIAHGNRRINLWSKENLDSPLMSIEVDSGSSSIFPFFDYDSNILFLAGKGDGNIRYYEVTDEKPYLHYLSQHMAHVPQRGIGMMPKRGLDTSRNEIMRFYRVCTIKNMIEPVSMIVPRRSDYFQPDIYPDTPGKDPALTSDEWVSGIDRDPILMSFGGCSRPNMLIIEDGEVKTSKEAAPTQKLAQVPKKMPYSGGDVTKPAEQSKPTSERTFRASPRQSPRAGSPISLPEANGKDSNGKESNGNVSKEDVLLSPREVKKKMLTDRFLASVEERKVSSKTEVMSDLAGIPKKHEWRSEESLPRSPSSEGDKFELQRLKSPVEPDSEDKLKRTTSVDGRPQESPQHRKKETSDTEADGNVTPAGAGETSNNGESTQSRIDAWRNKIVDPSSPQTSPKLNGRVQRQTSASFNSALSMNEIPTAEIRPRITSQEKAIPKQESAGSPKGERLLGRVGTARARYAEEVDKRNKQQQDFNRIRKQRSHSQDVEGKEWEKATQKPSEKQSISRSQSLREESELKTSSEFGVEQLRKAYLRQMDEIKQLKTQILLKDQRIKQLEKELDNSSN
ncbi:coronin-2B-like isoform X3 [Anneissia japonica]|uniref:coronin-2B-like isoform X3 n=1 Tax=Anneissia japonica TaxID=1529436 RepID=UPI0014256638|nr:coronin-2B-like isoform X3 [Anneissia japonica]